MVEAALAILEWLERKPTRVALRQMIATLVTARYYRWTGIDATLPWVRDDFDPDLDTFDLLLSGWRRVFVYSAGRSRPVGDDDYAHVSRSALYRAQSDTHLFCSSYTRLEDDETVDVVEVVAQATGLTCLSVGRFAHDDCFCGPPENFVVSYRNLHHPWSLSGNRRDTFTSLLAEQFSAGRAPYTAEDHVLSILDEEGYIQCEKSASESRTLAPKNTPAPLTPSTSMPVEKHHSSRCLKRVG